MPEPDHADAQRRLLLAAAELTAAGALLSIDVRFTNGLRLSFDGPPAVATATPGEPLPHILDALQLSEDEARVVAAIRRAGQALLGKQLAATMGRDYTTKLKFLLSNMEARGVLLHDDARGYFLPNLTPNEN